MKLKSRVLFLRCGHQIVTQEGSRKTRTVTWCPYCKVNRPVDKTLLKYMSWPVTPSDVEKEQR